MRKSWLQGRIVLLGKCVSKTWSDNFRTKFPAETSACLLCSPTISLCCPMERGTLVINKLNILSFLLQQLVWTSSHCLGVLKNLKACSALTCLLISLEVTHAIPTHDTDIIHAHVACRNHYRLLLGYSFSWNVQHCHWDKLNAVKVFCILTIWLTHDTNPRELLPSRNYFASVIITAHLSFLILLGSMFMLNTSWKFFRGFNILCVSILNTVNVSIHQCW